jgi:hypothetical protein
MSKIERPTLPAMPDALRLKPVAVAPAEMLAAAWARQIGVPAVPFAAPGS